MSKQRGCEAHADHMADNENRDAQPEDELREFDAGPAKVPARIQRPEPEAEMDRDRAVQQDDHRPALPEHRVVVERVVHHIERDVAERMIGKMADQIGEQDEAGEKPHLTQPDASEQAGKG